MRILHVNNQASVGYHLSRAQRELGHRSDLLAVPEPSKMEPDFKATSAKMVLLRLLRYAPRYDIIHVHGGVGISGAALLPLRAVRKRFFSHYHGSELRGNRQNSFYFINERIFVSTPDLLDYSDNVGGRELIHIPNPVCMERIPARGVHAPFKELEEGLLRVAHMPSVRSVKGTVNVERAVSDLEKEGSRIELDIIEGLTHENAMKRLEKAHICIDWMSPDYRIHGVVSVEAMARGIPVICNIDRSLYPEEIPIIPSGPSRLKKVLQGILDGRADMTSLSDRSMEYARKYHEPLSVARRLDRYI